MVGGKHSNCYYKYVSCVLGCVSVKEAAVESSAAPPPPSAVTTWVCGTHWPRPGDICKECRWRGGGGCGNILPLTQGRYVVKGAQGS